MTAMSKNTYPLVGPRYPLFLPSDPKNSKSKFLPWGRRHPQTLTLGSSYLRRREAAAVASTNTQDLRHDDRSYPRMWWLERNDK